jgi:Flp pilus assembly protein TadD
MVTAALVPSTAYGQYIGGGAPAVPVAPVPGAVESPAAALARHVRILAGSPRNYDALVGAGKAALATGDPEAAIGFYARAEEVHPASWVPKIGQGAALVQLLEPGAAMQAFDAAQRLGATHAAIALDRGLAFDLLGDQARAQGDYRLALAGTDPNEARRRLALSLAVSGRRADALAAIDPLLARRDPAALRARAFVLALTGDTAGAGSAVEAALPGMSGNLLPFFRRLAALRPAEKVAAVHFGVIPGDGSALASAQPGDRLGDIDRLLHAGEPTLAPPPQPAPVAIAAAPPPRPPATLPSVTAATSAARPTLPPAAVSRPRLWLQLASGDAASLPREYQRLASRHRNLFAGISGYVAQDGARARLLIGPFKNRNDAATFAEDLASAAIDASSWTNPPGLPVNKLPAQ